MEKRLQGSMMGSNQFRLDMRAWSIFTCLDVFISTR